MAPMTEYITAKQFHEADGVGLARLYPLCSRRSASNVWRTSAAMQVCIGSGQGLRSRCPGFERLRLARVLFDPAGHPFCLCLDNG